MNNNTKEQKFKVCFGCKRDLPADNIHYRKKKAGKYGLQSRCKECMGFKFELGAINRTLKAKKGYKYCSKCKKELPANNNYFARHKSGLASSCKECFSEYYYDNREKHLKKYREEYKGNPQKYIDKARRYRNDNPEKVREQKKKHYRNNKDYYVEKSREYYQENKERLDEMNKEWARNNIDRRKEHQRRYYIKNRERESKRLKEYREKYPERRKQQVRNWDKNNPHKRRVYKARRRQREAKLPHYFTVSDWEEALIHFNNECAYCGMNKALEQDHFIPLTKGGGYIKSNIIPACRSCNSSKHNALFEEWYPKQEFYSDKRYKKALKFVGVKDNRHQLKLI